MLPKGDKKDYRLHKVRPVIESFLQKCKNIPQEETRSVDEQIIPIKCRSGAKQYLSKKPQKWGIKVRAPMWGQWNNLKVPGVHWC